MFFSIRRISGCYCFLLDVLTRRLWNPYIFHIPYRDYNLQQPLPPKLSCLTSLFWVQVHANTCLFVCHTHAHRHTMRVEGTRKRERERSCAGGGTSILLSSFCSGGLKNVLHGYRSDREFKHKSRIQTENSTTLFKLPGKLKWVHIQGIYAHSLLQNSA